MGNSKTDIKEFETILNGRKLSYCVRISSRAKKARLEIRPGTGLLVVIPRYYRISEVPELLVANKWWLQKKLPLIENMKMMNDSQQVSPGDKVMFLGREFTLVESDDKAGTTEIKIDNQEMMVTIPSNCSGDLIAILTKWYKEQAVSEINHRTKELSVRTGVTYNKVTIRAQRTRWGSCSQKGNLSFNWKLVTLPEPVLDYVVTHELLHIRQMNHSRNFWKLVCQYCPEYMEYRKWLRFHNALLRSDTFNWNHLHT